MAADGTPARLLAGAPLGILAGGSGVPIELAEAVVSHGGSVHIVGLEGEADPDITAYPHTWVNWGGIGAMIAAFRQAGCRQIVIVGRVRRPNLAKLRPDLGFWTSLPALLPFLRGGDDAILRLVVGFFERHGLEVLGAHEAAPELLAPAGLMGAIDPSPASRDAIRTGAMVLAALGPMDAAQAVVCAPSGLIAVEGADGTDAMLRRLTANGVIAPASDVAVLLKLPKPNQERRIDLPAIGPETVKHARKAGLGGVAVRAGETLIAERRAIVQTANDAGLFLVGLGAEHLASAVSSQPPTAELAQSTQFDVLNHIARRRPRSSDLEDVRLATGVAAALEPYWARTNVVVSRGYVLATEGPGGALAAAERARRLKPWGTLKLLKHKVGVLVMSDIAGELSIDPTRLISTASASNLSGIAVLRTPVDEAALAVLAAEADRAGMFILAPGDAL
jgi:DUF1009 family protein